MWYSDQHQRDIVHIFHSSEAKSQLDDFLNAWSDELCRTKGILRLNDDCLYKIFSYLPMIDLCTVNETCRDFQRISHDYFEAHSNRVGLDKLNFDGVRKNLIRLNDAKRFIRIFGSHLTKLDLRNDAFWVYEKPIKLLPLLDRYCTKLQTLTIDVSFSDPTISIVYRRLFSDLHRLTIGSYISHNDPLLGQIDVDMILSYLVSLKHLEINRMEWIVEEVIYDAKRYKSLESLSLRNSILPRIDVLTAFLSENDQLKRLKLSSCYFMKTEKSFTLTLPSFPNLESFWVRSRDDKYHRPSVKDFNPNQMSRLHLSNISGNLSALKKLCIDLNIFQKSNLNSILDRLATHNVIEKVDIVGTQAYPDELESHLCAFTNLKVLRLSYVKGFNKEIIKTLACGLPNLTYIEFKCCDVDYSMLENIMEFSHNVNTISLFLSLNIDSPLTKAVLSSMIDARLRNQYRKPPPLKLILNGIRYGTRFGMEMHALFKNCANVLKVQASDYLRNLVFPRKRKQFDLLGLPIGNSDQTFSSFLNKISNCATSNQICRINSLISHNAFSHLSHHSILSLLRF